MANIGRSNLQWDMEKVLRRILSIIGNINEYAGKGVAWLTTALVLLVVVDVVYRRLLSDTQTWIMEMEWHLFALIFLIGAGYALKHDRHVRVDLFYARFSARDKARVNLAGGVLFLLPWCIALMVFGYQFARDAWLIRETSPDPGGLPARYLIKFSIVIGAFLLFLQGIASVVEAVLELRGGTGETGFSKQGSV